LDPSWAADPDSCRQAIEAGVRVFSIGLDAVVFRSACQAMADAVDKGARGAKFTRPEKKNWGFAVKPLNRSGDSNPAIEPRKKESVCRK
jgi:hypothetical protein